jgi:hypothetical protein
VNAHRRPQPEAVLNPESAVWLLYAGLVQGIRWRRHLAASPPSKAPVARWASPAPPATR